MNDSRSEQQPGHEPEQPSAQHAMPVPPAAEPEAPAAAMPSATWATPAGAQTPGPVAPPAQSPAQPAPAPAQPAPAPAPAQPAPAQSAAYPQSAPYQPASQPAGQPAHRDPFAPPHGAYQAAGYPAAGLPPQPPMPPAPPAGWSPDAVGPLPTVPVASTTRPRWWPIVGAAAAAAVIASLGTAGLVNGLSSSHSTPVSLATLEPQTSSVVPVAGSTNTSPNWEAVAEAVRPSVVAITVTLSSGEAEGSGVVLDTKGHILTNNHVVADSTGDIEVTLSDGRVFKATIVGTDATTDLAVIKLTDPPDDLTPAVIGKSEEVIVGQPVMAVGNPLGLSSTVTTGIVSALDRPVSTSSGSSKVVTNAIQIDAAINPGNSGGPLFNASGEVIGITSSIATLSSGSGESGSIGLGFAIPSDLANRVAAELLADGTASHAYLGVTLKDGTATADGVTRRGAVVASVNDGTPAQKAGLKSGDVIVAIGDAPTSGAESLTGYVRELASGQTATLTVVRDGKAFDVDVTFTDIPASSDTGSSDQGSGQGNGDQGNGQQSPGQGNGNDGQQGFGGQDGFPDLPSLPWGQQG